MSIHEITDIDAFFAEQQANEDAANAATRPEQRALTWGDHFLRLYDTGNGVLAIFGRIVTAEEYERTEGAEGLHRAEQRMARGYRFAWCHSTVCPDGEPGDTHVAACWPISPEQYDDARANGWDPSLLPWITTIGPAPEETL